MVRIRLYQGVDLAISMKEDADYTAIVTVGVDDNGRVWIVDAVHDRVGFRDALALIKAQAEKWHPDSIAIEAVQYQAAVVEELLRSTILPVYKVRPDKDKLTRAQSLITRYENGLVWHSENLPRYFAEEILAFSPDCDHDDMVDAAVYAYMQTSDYNKPRLILPERESKTNIIEGIPGFEGLPSGIVQAIKKTITDRCGSCSAFNKERHSCEFLKLLVRPNDPGCDYYLKVE